MIYGLYLSATGVLTNSYRQDVIANNLANTQTVGFKRSLALFQQRRTEAQTLNDAETAGSTDPALEGIGGGLLLAPTHVDHSQGLIEKTDMNLDVAIHGRGYFAVSDAKSKEASLTRNGRLMLDRDGFLILADGSNHRLLDEQMRPIELGNVPSTQVKIETDGTISVAGQVRGRLGLFDVPDEKLLTLRGQNLMTYPDMKKLTAATAEIQSGYVENSNVDPMTEMTQLINAHRLLEANANMIRYQDQTLSKLVNEVGKIG